MPKSISAREYASRFAGVDVIQYTSISSPATVRCRKCGKIVSDSSAWHLMRHFACDCTCASEDEAWDFSSGRQVNGMLVIDIDGKSYAKCVSCGKVIRVCRNANPKCPRCGRASSQGSTTIPAKGSTPQNRGGGNGSYLEMG